mmetsp:Transcript_39984/g.107233  ORF Transcript_39984/g.107233 Transcript_39984/m.107233 type:complete len:228 (-) Transcript_39984:402-1085(-)
MHNHHVAHSNTQAHESGGDAWRRANRGLTHQLRDSKAFRRRGIREPEVRGTAAAVQGRHVEDVRVSGAAQFRSAGYLYRRNDGHDVSVCPGGSCWHHECGGPGDGEHPPAPAVAAPGLARHDVLRVPPQPHRPARPPESPGGASGEPRGAGHGDAPAAAPRRCAVRGVPWGFLPVPRYDGARLERRLVPCASGHHPRACGHQRFWEVHPVPPPLPLLRPSQRRHLAR